MKADIVVSFFAAAVCHALLLFGFHFGTPARALTTDDEPTSVDVNLVEASPAPPFAPPNPAPTPETQPTPEPSQELSAPPSGPPPVQPGPPAPVLTPPPHSENPKPRPPSAGRSAASSASALAPSSGVVNSPALKSYPRYRSNPRPDYPPDALRMHQEGVVLLTVDVTAEGRVSNVTLKRSSGYNSLDQAAIRGVRGWTFDPARAGGLPVSSRVDVPVRFSLSK